MERRWWTLRDRQFSTNQMLAKVDENVAILQEAQQCNFERWPVLGSYVWPNDYHTINTWSGDVNTMRGWLTNRLAWMDTQMGEKRFEEEPDKGRFLAYFWLFDTSLENDTPLNEIEASFNYFTETSKLSFESSLIGYSFNPQTTIQYRLAYSTEVLLEVFNM